MTKHWIFWSWLLYVITINISSISAQSDTSETEDSGSAGEAYAALGILCALAILFLIICADIIHKRFQSNRDLWYPQLDPENTLIGRNPDDDPIPINESTQTQNQHQIHTIPLKNNTKDINIRNKTNQGITQGNNDKNPLLSDSDGQTDGDNDNGNDNDNDIDIVERRDEPENENEQKEVEQDLTAKELLQIQQTQNSAKRDTKEFLNQAWDEEVDEMEKEDKMNALESVRVSLNARLIKSSQISDTPQSTAL